MYVKLFKRLLDLFLSIFAISVLSPILLILTVAGAIAMHGNPFFAQPRPGKWDKNGNETIFRLFKFRTMTNKCDENGKLLPDEKRLNAYGKFLRSTSLDELPSLVNILIGNLSIVGPRPQLVRDMIFMSEEQRRRHSVRPGLTGLAQISGRNNITWESKFEYDLEYIDRKMHFLDDVRIVFGTVGTVLRREDTVRDGTASDLDFGDWLLAHGKIDRKTYDEKQAEAMEILRAYEENCTK